MGVRVHQEDEDKLKATVKQKEKDRTVTGDVTVVQPDASKLKATLSTANPETDDSLIPDGEVRETQLALLYAHETGFGWVRLKTAGALQDNALYVFLKGGSTTVLQTVAANLKAEVYQPTAANLKAEVTQASADRTVSGDVEVIQDTAADLKATVTQAAKDRTITGTVEVVQDTPADLKCTVTPSGDMARKMPYDRNLTLVQEMTAADYGNHAITERWRYTTPASHYFQCSIISMMVKTVINNAGTEALCYTYDDTDLLLSVIQYSTTIPLFQAYSSPVFYLKAGNYMMYRTKNGDNVNHSYYGNMIGLEFDV